MTKRQENKERMEQKIFDAAIDLFCEMGYQKTTLVDIAAEAEVSTRTLYKYFPTKESILRKFTQDNILALRDFAQGLPEDMPLFDKVIETMVMDAKTMFGLFDIDFILHPAKNDSRVYTRFDQENIIFTEAIYGAMFRREQEKMGIEPNENALVCGSIAMAIYRHCTDLYRVRYNGPLDETRARDFYRAHLECIWPAIPEALSRPPGRGAKLVVEEQGRPVVEQ